jgi:hypothetical protein
MEKREIVMQVENAVKHLLVIVVYVVLQVVDVVVFLEVLVMEDVFKIVIVHKLNLHNVNLQIVNFVMQNVVQMVRHANIFQ